LSYRHSCAHGICGSDDVVINDRIELACQKLIKDYKTGNNFVIEPLPLFKVVKDLIVDLNPCFEKHRMFRPYLISDLVNELTVPVLLLDCILSGGNGIPFGTHQSTYSHAQGFERIKIQWRPALCQPNK